MKKIANIKLHPAVLIPKKNHPLHIDKVEKWLDKNNDLANKYAQLSRKKEKGVALSKKEKGALVALSLIHEGYVKEIKHYLRYGDWISSFYGEDQEFKPEWRIIA